MNVSFLQELLNTVAEQGRTLIPWSLKTASPANDIKGLTRALVSGRGEASGVAIARQVIACYRALSPAERKDFFLFLASDLQPNPDLVAERARAYVAEPGQAALSALQAAVESPRQEFFRRLNLAPGATAEIIGLRLDLLNHLRTEPALTAVDYDLRHLLQSWFNRGFLVLRRIDWQTPAAILEKIIAYEAVHEIRGWDDLRRRLEPADRRCFAYFHPSLVDEPLIFVEVALMRETPGAIGDVLAEARKGSQQKSDPTTAVFYSISNCQEGLKGVSFGNFLIKHVVEDLLRELPTLKTFVTLSPVPHFARWLDRMAADDGTSIVTAEDRVALKRLRDPGWHERAETVQALKGPMMALASHYFLSAKSGDGRAVDPVARFHLGNGARLERLNWLGDTSEKGLTEAHGLMVNYLYNLDEIERNHEAYANEGLIAASKAVRATLRPAPKLVAKPTPEPRRLDPPAKPATKEPTTPPVDAPVTGKR